MADLDAELLALAGGDTSSDEENPSKTRTKTESPPSSPTSPKGTQQRDSGIKLGVARKKSTKMSGVMKRPPKRAKRQESEEGEASSGHATPDSLRSATMSESDSDRSPPGAEVDGPVFPFEQFYYSEEDKAKIMAMSEVQRESILAERAAIRDRKSQDLHLRKLLQAREREEAKAADKKKRKAGDAELDEKQRKSSRQKTTLGGRKVGESSDAMEAYKRQREQKGLRDEQRRKEGEERKERAKRGEDPVAYSDADAEGESEVEWDDVKARGARRSTSAPRDDTPAELKDYEHVRVGRDNFAMVCFYPGFEKAITNCLIRISLGPDKATGENVYRIAHIKGEHSLSCFTEGKPYAMEGLNGKPFVTSQYATVAVGKAEKEWPFIACSNSKFTEAEFGRYKRTMAAESLPLPTRSFLLSKLEDINTLLDHTWTEEEIQQKLKRSGVLQTRFAAFERNQILRHCKEAEDRGDEAAIAKCDADLAALDGPKLAFGTSLNASPRKASVATGPTEQERLAILNRNNRKQNQQEVRKAQQAERKAEALNKAAIERGEAVANPFARVKTRAKIHYDVRNDTLAPPPSAPGLDELFEGGNSDRSRAGTPLNPSGTNTPLKVPTPKRIGTPKTGMSRSGTPLLTKRDSGEKKRGIPTIRKRNMDDDLIAAMDLGIEIDI